MPYRIDPKTGQKVYINAQTGQSTNPMQSVPQTQQQSQPFNIGEFLKSIVQKPVNLARSAAGGVMLAGSAIPASIATAYEGATGRELKSASGGNVKQNALNQADWIKQNVIGADLANKYEPTNPDNSKFIPAAATEGVREGLGTAAFMVPGGTTAKGVLASGATSGLLTGVSEEGATPSSVAASTVGGAGGAYLTGYLAPKAISKIGSGLKGGSKNLVLSSISPSPTQQRDFSALAGETIEDFASSRGLMGRDPKVVQAAIEPLQQAFDDIALNSGKKGTVMDILNRFAPVIKKYSESTSEEDKVVGRKLTKIVENFMNKYGDGVVDVADFTAERRTFDKYLNSKDFTAVQTATAKQANKEARSLIQNVVEDITQTEKLPDGKSLKDVGKELQKLYALRDIMEKQAGKGKGSSIPFGLLSSGAGGLTGVAAAQDDLRTGNYPAAATKILVGMGLGKLASNPKVIGAIAKSLEKTGGKLESTTGSEALQIASRAMGANIGSATQLPVGQESLQQDNTNNINQPANEQLEHSETISQTGSPFNGMDKQEFLAQALQKGAVTADLNELSKVYDMLSAQQKPADEYIENKPKEQEEGAYSPNQLYKAMFKARIANDTASYNALKDMYEMAVAEEKRTKSTSGKPTSIAGATRYDLAQSGLRSLKDVERIIKNDPAVLTKELVPGKLASREYDSAAFAAAEALLRMRSGAAVPEQEVRRYMTKVMPIFGDNKKTIDLKLQRLKENYLDVISSSDDIQDMPTGTEQVAQ